MIYDDDPGLLRFAPMSEPTPTFQPVAVDLPDAHGYVLSTVDRMQDEHRAQQGFDPQAVVTIVDSDTARLEFKLGPEDRAAVRASNVRQAIQYANAINSPAGLAGLFPTNRVRCGSKKLVQPLVTPRR